MWLEENLHEQPNKPRELKLLKSTPALPVRLEVSTNRSLTLK
jgi:hypothetical protein